MKLQCIFYLATIFASCDTTDASSGKSIRGNGGNPGKPKKDSASPAPSPTPDMCGVPQYDASTLLSDLATHRSIWESYLGFANSYCMTYTKSCYCTPEYRGPFRVCVQSGRVISATTIDRKEPVTDPDVLSSLRSIEDLFGIVQTGLDNRYYNLIAEYSDSLGFPFHVYEDGCFGIADDEHEYWVSDVVVDN